MHMTQEGKSLLVRQHSIVLTRWVLT